MKTIAYAPRPKIEWRGAPPEVRKRWVKDMFIKHPKVSYTLTAIGQKVERCHLTGRGDGMFVLGETGSGKSRLIEYLEEVYGALPEVLPTDRTLLPVISVTIPENCTRKQFMVQVLSAMKADTLGTYDQLKKRVLLLFRSCGVVMVLVDNLQDIPARRSARGVHDIAIVFRDLIDFTSALFILFGNKDGLVVLNTDLELRKRIPFRSSLHYFDVTQQVNKKEYVRLMHELDKWLPLAETSCIIEPAAMENLFFGSAGIFQYIVQLLDIAWPLAVAQGRESINNDDLYTSFTRLYGDVGSSINPFGPNAVKRILNQPGEPFHGWI